MSELDSETPPPVTLRMLAKAAGVSVGTASQALRGAGSTSRKTSEHIRHLAQVMGYQPDPLMSRAGARRRAGERGRVAVPVGLLTGRGKTDQAVFPTTRYYNECAQILRANGFDFFEATVSSMPELQRTLREWYYRGMQGIFLSNLLHQEWLGEPDWSPFSIIYLGGRFHRPRFNTVCLNYPQALHLTIKRALETQKRVGVILHYHPPGHVFDDCLREGVVLQHQRIHPTQIVPLLRIPFYGAFEEEVKLFDEWLHKHQPEILVGFDKVNSLMNESRQPQRPLVIPTADTLAPGCAGGLESSYELVTIAVNMLEGMIRRRERGVPARPSLTSIPPSIIWPKGFGNNPPLSE